MNELFVFLNIPQIIKMLIAVVVVFLLCWGPKVIFDVIIKLSPEVLFSIASFRAKVTLKAEKY